MLEASGTRSEHLGTTTSRSAEEEASRRVLSPLAASMLAISSEKVVSDASEEVPLMRVATSSKTSAGRKSMADELDVFSSRCPMLVFKIRGFAKLYTLIVYYQIRHHRHAWRIPYDLRVGRAEKARERPPSRARSSHHTSACRDTPA